MAVNLPPQYHDAEARFKKAKTTEEKLAALREMWVILPKHKASEKVQAALKTKISELTDQQDREKNARRKPRRDRSKSPGRERGKSSFSARRTRGNRDCWPDSRMPSRPWLLIHSRRASRCPA